VIARARFALPLVLGAFLASGTAFAQLIPSSPTPTTAAPAASAPATPASPTPPQPIPVPEIVRRAEEVTTRLRAMEENATARTELEDIEKRLPAVAEDVLSRVAPTLKALADSPPSGMLDNYVSPLLAARTLLSGWAATLGRHATQAESDLAELAALRAAWQATRTEARDTGAPSAVLDRIDGILSAIAEAETSLRARRAHILLLQDRVARETEIIEGLLARISAARAEADRQILSRDGLPIWQAVGALDSLREVPARTHDWILADRAALRRFRETHGALIVLHVLIWVTLSIAFYLLRRRVPTDPADQRLAEASRLFRYPLAMALLVALFFSPWLYGELPRPVRTLIFLIGVFPVLRVYTLLAPQPLRASFVALTAFFVLERLDDIASVVPLLNQLVFLAEMALAITLIVVILASYRHHAAEPSMPLVRALGVAMLATMAAGFLLAVFGYTRFGRLLGAGALSVGYYAMVFQALYRVALALLAYALRMRPLTYLRFIHRNRPIVEWRVGRFFWWLAVAGWVVVSLANLGLFWKVYGSMTALFSVTLTRGSLSISVGDVTAFAITVWLSFALSRLVRFLLEEDVYPRLPLARGVPNMVSTLLHYSILFLGFLFAIAAMGMDLNRVTILAGAFGVGIGFGLQSVVNNFVSGLILLVERSIQVGDVVQVGDTTGEVRSIGIRASMVRTGEGGDVIVPNAFLAAERVTNWTLTDRIRRVDIPVRVAYGADPERVLDLLRGTCTDHPGVLRDPVPMVFFDRFADNGLLFQIWVWTPRIEDALPLKSALGLAIFAALRNEGIEIPLPQTELRVRDGDGAAARALAPSPRPSGVADRGPGGPPPPVAGASSEG
jgi:potassium-dependent mechanosensitive channel